MRWAFSTFKSHFPVSCVTERLHPLMAIRVYQVWKGSNVSFPFFFIFHYDVLSFVFHCGILVNFWGFAVDFCFSSLKFKILGLLGCAIALASWVMSTWKVEKEASLCILFVLFVFPYLPWELTEDSSGLLCYWNFIWHAHWWGYIYLSFSCSGCLLFRFCSIYVLCCFVSQSSLFWVNRGV